MKKIPVYIGIEIKVREFAGKVFLACVAAEEGYTAILGQQKIFKRTLERMPPGIYIDKSTAANKAARHALLKKLGFHVVVYDEEGLVFVNPEEYQKRRLSPETFQHVDTFFAWGQRQAEVVADQFPHFRKKILPVGHPRLDLTRPELRAFYAEDVKKLQQRYGKFVLINTNFSWCNHARGENALMAMLEKTGKIVDDQQRRYYQALQRHKSEIFKEFSRMVEKISEHFPQIGIVVRPHPTEDGDYWNHVLPQNSRISVAREGNVLPWLLAAEVTIHNSCSTGVECYLLERPVISYQPNRNDSFDTNVQNQLSEQVLTFEALLHTLTRILQEQSDRVNKDDKKRRLAEYYMTGIHGDFASERLVRALLDLPPRPISVQGALYRLYRNTRTIGGKVRRTIFQKVSPQPKDSARQTRAYNRQKFPGITEEEVRRVIATFNRITGRFAHVTVTRLEENMFEITT